jgi:beta-glucanase (GH16 family)
MRFFISLWLSRRLVCRARCLLAIAFLLLVNTGRAMAQGCHGVSASTSGAVTWIPQWCQEFNATTPAPPDTTVWKFDLGNSGFGNNEVETYCGPPGYPGNSSNCPSTFAKSSSNAYLDGAGHLVIQIIKSNGTWFSARMKTQGLENFRYGRIEASIQLPNTTSPGLWPAFWSLGSDIATTPWPACGEADFMENWSAQVHNGPGPGGNASTIHTALTGGDGIGGRYTFPSGQQADTSFHDYGTISSANMMQFYVDDPTRPFLIETTSNLPSGDTWPFNKQLFLLINVAVGGTLGGSTANTPSPDQMLVDYIRQYQPSVAVSVPAMGTPPSITVKAGATTGNTSTFTPALTPGTGYVYFSCGTNAPNASCAITTTDPLNKFVVNSSAAESVTITVATTANTATAISIPPLFFNPKLPIWLPIPLAVFFVALVVVCARSRRWHYSWKLAAGLFFAGAVTVGSGGNSTPITPPSNRGTPPGSYTVTIYAFTESNTGNGSNSNADASVAIPLAVN